VTPENAPLEAPLRLEGVKSWTRASVPVCWKGGRRRVSSPMYNTTWDKRNRAAEDRLSARVNANMTSLSFLCLLRSCPPPPHDSRREQMPRRCNPLASSKPHTGEDLQAAASARSYTAARCSETSTTDARTVIKNLVRIHRGKCPRLIHYSSAPQLLASVGDPDYSATNGRALWWIVTLIRHHPLKTNPFPAPFTRMPGTRVLVRDLPRLDYHQTKYSRL